MILFFKFHTNIDELFYHLTCTIW